MTTYKTTYAKGMNTRPDHNVNNAPNGTVSFGASVDVLETWKATADGVNVRAGDEWAKVGPTQWVAVKHMGVIYGVLEGIVVTPPPVPSEPILPLSFILTDPATGKRAEYTFVRLVE